MALIACAQSLCSIDVFASGLSFCRNRVVNAAEINACCADVVPERPAIVNACVEACGATA